MPLYSCTLFWWFRNWWHCLEINQTSTHRWFTTSTAACLFYIIMPQNYSELLFSIFSQPCMFPCWLLSALIGGYFKVFVLAALQVKSTNTFPPHLDQGKWPPWPPPAHRRDHSLQYLQAGKPLLFRAACAECSIKSVLGPTSPCLLMPAFPTCARCRRVSRHLF